MTQRPSNGLTTWYLEGVIDESGKPFQIPVTRLPFRVGREAGLELSLPSQVVSSQHAAIFKHGNRLMVSDLGSTNGTFVNKIPVEGEVPLEDGDIIQFATFTFRFRIAESGVMEALQTSTATIDSHLMVQMAESFRKLKALLEEQAVTQLFQPIVSLTDSQILGYEVLGRGDYDGLPGGIYELFQLAEPIGAEVDLSLVLRRRSVAACGSLAGDHCYFLNTHPAELQDNTLVSSLRDARAAWPELRLAIEIHESAVTDPSSVQELRQELEDLDMLLVYDDFGAGQARLLELAEVPPDFLKFDRSLIRQVEPAPSPRWRLLEGLVNMAQELGISMIAEGLESQTELEICRELGFAYGQGYLLSVPRPCEEVNGALVPPQLNSQS